MKKAQQELTFVFGLILLSVILTLAFIMFLTASKGHITKEVNALTGNEVNINLLNYLRTLNKETGHTLAESIAYAYDKKDYSEIEKTFDELFAKFHDKQKCSILYVEAVSEKSNERLFTAISMSNKIESAPRFSTMTIIPTFNPEDNIKITYMEGCLK